MLRLCRASPAHTTKFVTSCCYLIPSLAPERISRNSYNVAVNACVAGVFGRRVLQCEAHWSG